MANKQTTIPFCVRKTSNTKFYSVKPEDDASHATPNKNLDKKEAPVYVPRVKKIFELNSSDENIDISIIRTPQKNLKRKYTKKSKKEVDDLSNGIVFFYHENSMLFLNFHKRNFQIVLRLKFLVIKLRRPFNLQMMLKMKSICS